MSLIVHGPAYVAKNSVSPGHVSAQGVRSLVFRSVAWTELSTIAPMMDDARPTLRVMELAIKRSTFSTYGMFERLLASLTEYLAPKSDLASDFALSTMSGLQEMMFSVAIDDMDEDWIAPVLRLLCHVPCSIEQLKIQVDLPCSIEQLKIQVDLTAWPEGCSFPSKVICNPWSRIASILREQELDKLQRVHVQLCLGRQS